MKADIVTHLSGLLSWAAGLRITRRAQEMGLAKIEVHDLRGLRIIVTVPWTTVRSRR